MITVYTSRSHEELAALDRKLWDELTPERRAHNDHISAMHSEGEYIEATNVRTGKRSRFRFAEHFNIGPGWQMWDIDDRHRVVCSFDLADVVHIPTTDGFPELRSFDGQVTIADSQ